MEINVGESCQVYLCTFEHQVLIYNVEMVDKVIARAHRTEERRMIDMKS